MYQLHVAVLHLRKPNAIRQVEYWTVQCATAVATTVMVSDAKIILCLWMVLTKLSHTYCVGECGGKGCADHPGGKENCCTKEIEAAHKSCEDHKAPCVIS